MIAACHCQHLFSNQTIRVGNTKWSYFDYKKNYLRPKIFGLYDSSMLGGIENLYCKQINVSSKFEPVLKMNSCKKVQQRLAETCGPFLKISAISEGRLKSQKGKNQWQMMNWGSCCWETMILGGWRRWWSSAADISGPSPRVGCSHRGNRPCPWTKSERRPSPDPSRIGSTNRKLIFR